MLQVLLSISKEIGYEGVWILFVSLLSLYLVSEILRLRRQRRADAHKAIQATLRLLKDITKSNLAEEHYQRLSEAALREIYKGGKRDWKPRWLSSSLPNLLKTPTLCGLIAASIIFSVQICVLWDQVSGSLGLRTRKLIAVSFMLHFFVGATSTIVFAYGSSWTIQLLVSILAVVTVYIVFGSLIVYIDF
jgi:hypothetical protein